MQRIPSFSIDHTRLAKGLYLSREDDDVKTWDVRILEPNHGHYLSTAVRKTVPLSRVNQWFPKILNSHR